MFNQLGQLSIRLEHQHSDGTWGALKRVHHDPADHDPERDWARGEVYECTTCDELVRVSPAGDEPAGGAR
jgi:hypothetical protein